MAEKTLKLEGPDGARDFRLEHAENLLRLQTEIYVQEDQKFRLPDKSHYEFENGTLRRRSAAKNTTEAESTPD